TARFQERRWRSMCRPAGSAATRPTTSPAACARSSGSMPCRPASAAPQADRAEPTPMSFADHIRACNNFDRSRVVPLLAAGRRIGWLRRDNAAALARFDSVFAVEPERVRLVVEGDSDTISAAVDEIVEALVVEKSVPKWRNETFDVAPRWGDPPIFRLDRGAVPFFGVRAYGVHLNGYRYIHGEMRLWIGRRAPDKRVAPNKLD